MLALCRPRLKASCASNTRLGIVPQRPGLPPGDATDIVEPVEGAR
jgi:hypothetical protein